MKTLFSRIVFCVAAALAVPSIAIAEPNLGISTVYSGDFNGDGVVDLYVETKTIVIVSVDDLFVPILAKQAPILFSSKIQSGGVDYILTVNPAPVAYNPATAGTYTAIQGDFNGDGRVDTLFRSGQSGANHLVMLSTGSAPYFDYVQTLNVATIGYDLGAPDTGFDVKDLNGDNRADLLIRRDGSYLGVLLASAGGTFARPSVADEGALTVIAVWNGLKVVMKGGDTAAALKFFGPTIRSAYSRIFTDLGTGVAAQVLTEVLTEVSEFRPVEISSDIASYAVLRTVNGAPVVNLVTFLRDGDSVWRVQGL